MLIFLIWLLFALIVGVAANARGRNGPGWFLISAIVSPLIGFLFLMAIPNYADRRALHLRPEDDVLYRVGKARRSILPRDSNLTVAGIVIALLLVGLYFAGFIKVMPTP
ncbi:MAG: hypothetical protein V4477_17005 [Pseudomonadota bacterium]